MAKKKNNHNDFYKSCDNLNEDIMFDESVNVEESQKEIIEKIQEEIIEKIQENFVVETNEIDDNDKNTCEEIQNEIQNSIEDIETVESCEYDDNSEINKRKSISGKVIIILKKYNKAIISTDKGNYTIPNNNYKINQIVEYIF